MRARRQAVGVSRDLPKQFAMRDTWCHCHVPAVPAEVVLRHAEQRTHRPELVFNAGQRLVNLALIVDTICRVTVDRVYVHTGGRVGDQVPIQFLIHLMMKLACSWAVTAVSRAAPEFW